MWDRVIWAWVEVILKCTNRPGKAVFEALIGIFSCIYKLKYILSLKQSLTYGLYYKSIMIVSIFVIQAHVITIVNYDRLTSVL